MLPPRAETGRGETVDEVARRPVRPDGAGRATLHLGRGEGDHVGGEGGCVGRTDAERDRGARGRNEQDTGEDNEPPSHVRILARESRAPFGASRIRLEPQDDSSAEASGKTRAAENGTMILVSASTFIGDVARSVCPANSAHLVSAS